MNTVNCYEAYVKTINDLSEQRDEMLEILRRIDGFFKCGAKVYRDSLMYDDDDDITLSQCISKAIAKAEGK